MKILTLTLIALMAYNTWATDLNQDMDALGANKDLMRKARAIDPNNQVRVVQKREVDRTMRLELGINYGMTATGGDPYLNTTALGGQLDFHLTPRWSVGARYTNYSNTLNAEGQNQWNDAQAKIAAGQSGVRLPALAYVKDSYIGVVNWYPIYGKLNFFDSGIAQFDLYVVGGAGQINIDTGSEPLYTAGGGVGIWWSQHISSRLEARWQGYNEKVFDGIDYQTRNMNETVFMFTLGFIL